MKNLLTIIIFAPAILFAQEFNFAFEPDSIPVEINGWSPYCPWIGGYSETAPDFCDIDSDGKLDLFIGNYTHFIDYYKNIGSITVPNFRLFALRWDSISCLPNNNCTNPDFWDLDGDNDYDLLIGAGYVVYYENIGTQFSPGFSGYSDTLFDISGNWVFGTHVALIDIDADGDGDLICGEYQGHLQFYRNIGTPNSFAFYLEDDHWLGISIPGYNSSPDPTFCDIDADGDYDLFIGERYGHIWYYQNAGDSVNYNFVYVSNYYDSIDVGDYASPEFADVDGDGDYDLLVGRECDYLTNVKGDIYYYENIGTSINPQFQYITKNYLMMDEGSFNLPQLVDIDSDQDLELIVNNAHGLQYYENIGTPEEPSFQFEQENFQNIPSNRPFTFWVDIDSDGDYDLFAGQSIIPGPPTIALYINRGNPQIPNLVLSNANYITNPDFHTNINPVLADIDGDGDYDLFATDDNGNFYYYQNNGSPQTPNFMLMTNLWQGIQYPTGNYIWKGMCFADVDEDGDLDLLMRNCWQADYGNIRLYRNNGTPQNANMVYETNIFIPGIEIAEAVPNLMDIDNDGDLDLFCGCCAGNGGIMFFRNLGMYGEAEITITISGMDVILNWGNIADAVEYHIYYQDTPYFTPTGVPQAVVMPPDTSWTDEGALLQGERYYRVVVEY